MFQDHRISYFEKLWREGTLKDPFTNNEYIDQNDEKAYRTFIARHTKATESPVLLAEMVNFEKKLNQQGIKSIFLFPGQGELSRFMKSRYGLVQEIPSSIANSCKSLIIVIY